MHLGGLLVMYLGTLCMLLLGDPRSIRFSSSYSAGRAIHGGGWGILRDAPEYKRIFCIQDHHQQFIRSLKKKIIGIGEIFVVQESITGGGSDRRILLFDVSPGCRCTR